MIRVFFSNVAVEEFCSDGSEFYVAFFENLFVPFIISKANITLRINNKADSTQTVAIRHNYDDRQIEIAPRASVEFSLSTELRFGAVGESEKGVYIKIYEWGAAFSHCFWYRIK